MTIDLSLLPDGGISWADASGPEGHIVLSTRIRLARNLQGTTFTLRARDEERERILQHVLAAARDTKALADAALFRLETLPRAAKVTNVSISPGGGTETTTTTTGPQSLSMQLSVNFYTTDTSAGPGSQPKAGWPTRATTPRAAGMLVTRPAVRKARPAPGAMPVCSRPATTGTAA